ncbi:MAG: 2-(1,2-epoxy-1,2-dihydrophenyl)acetyl-CoA isomerase [Alphaproteobacteria bacterium]|nr:2-(1,2-epoxy-1,2-dihydrophenyl)acetyl-CoA isomerase [Alphaproteobacteria bacterium]MBV9967354.1 2-(1,2-epoxy-1,2-dihydrophenyl)acetyl-CoA isomerase [Alphaproteobacteria bacterium]
MTILVEKREGYRRITLNRPERLNALTTEMAAALSSALDEAEADKNCRALLLTGAGRGFCAGQDLHEIVGASASDLERLLEHYHPLILKIRALPIPVVCAVNGVAAGAGANLALSGDIVLAARSASFVQAFARIGLVPDCGGTWFLPRLVGTARARALALLAEPLPAETAAEWGLVWRMVEDDRLMPEAEALATRLAAQAGAALALTKRALDAALGNTLAQQLDLEGELQREAGAHPDHAEGVRAFLEKRPAVFAKARS